MRNIFIYVTIAFGILFSSCEKDKNDTSNGVNVDNTIIVDNTLFNSATSDDFDFTDVEIVGDSLKITISYGGGCGDIDIKLIDYEDIMESYPAQRNIRLILIDEDPCEALLTKEFSFDLTPIKISSQNKILLNLTGWDSQMLYQY